MKLTHLFILCSLLFNMGLSVKQMPFAQDDFGEDDLILPEFIQTSAKKVPLKKIQEDVLNYITTLPKKDYSGDGYIDLGQMKNSITAQNSGNLHGYRFKSFLSAPRNPNAPGADDVMIEKRGLSNGMVLFGKKRTGNFETNLYN